MSSRRVTRFLVAAPLVAAALGACTSARRSEPISGTFNADTPTIAHGERLFMEHCQPCHPGGAAGLGPAINNKPLPAFMIRTQVRLGVGAMPAFSQRDLSPADLDALIAYVRARRAG